MLTFQLFRCFALAVLTAILSRKIRGEGLTCSENECGVGNINATLCYFLPAEDQIKCECRLQNGTKCALTILDNASRTTDGFNYTTWQNLESSMILGNKKVSPLRQMWAQCHFCGYKNGQVQIYDPNYELFTDSNTTRVLLAQNRYSSHFDNTGDKIYGIVKRKRFNSQKCARMLNRPVYIVSLLYLQIGHLLIDVIEPLFNMMMAEFGVVRKDALLIFEVASDQKRAMFAEELSSKMISSPFKMIQFFTEYSILSKSSFDKLREETCFSNLHVGLTADSYIHLDSDSHPDVILPYSNFNHHVIQQKYQSFQQFINRKELIKEVKSDEASPSIKILNISLIFRATGRKLLNFFKLKRLCQKFGNVRVLTLENMDFTAQVTALRSTSILIGVYGTGLHNCLFLRHYSAIIIIMQDSWCHLKRNYANQAILAGIHVFVYCNSPLSYDTKVFRWSENGFNRGSIESRDQDILVNASLFERLLDHASTLINNKSTKPALHKVVGTNVSFLDREKIRPNFSARASIGKVSINKDRKEVVVIPQVLLKGFDPKLFILENPQIRYCMMLLNFDESSYTSSSCVPYGIPGPLIIRNIASNNFAIVSYLLNAKIPEEIEGSDTIYYSSSVSELNDKFCLKHVVVNSSFTCIRMSNYIPPVLVNFQLNNQLRTLLIGISTTGDEIERIVSVFCSEYLIDVEMCRRIITYSFHKQLKRKIEFENYHFQHYGSSYEVPNIQIIPTLDNPFVFLHNEKCAGSTLRRYIKQAGDKYNLTYVIPGKNGIPHMTFDFTNIKGSSLRRSSIISGHFDWGIWDQLDRVSTNFSCFTMLRNPVDRVISLYYERVYPITKRRINSLSRNQLNELVVNFLGSSKGIYRDEGMSNAFCRMLCGANNRKGRLPKDAIEMPFSRTLATLRIKKCIVGMVEEWENTQVVIDHWFPWLHFKHDMNRNVGYRDKESSTTLNADLKRIIEKHNDCDIDLYHNGKRQFQEQLKIVQENK